MDLYEPPAKRRRPNPRREIGLMRQSHAQPGSATFLGSSSGIHFIRIVYNAFARRSRPPPTVPDHRVPGEDDQLPSPAPPQQPALWQPHELDARRSSSKTIAFDTLVQLTRSYFDHWHPLFPFLLGPAFLRILDLAGTRGLARLSTPETILVRAVVSISLLDRRQTGLRGPPVPAALVFRSVEDALQSLHALFCDPPTLPLLQAAFSVQLFLASLLRLNAASRVGGIVVRAAFHLGLHRCPARFAACFPPDEAAVRQRLFWSIYALERYLAQALGVPLSIRDDDVDVCYPGAETHGEGVAMGSPAHLARFARVRGLIVELRNKSIRHSQESSVTATQVNGELVQWWNEVYDDVLDDDGADDEDAPARLAPLHRLVLVVLRHESILSMNRPLLATDVASPEYKTALQVCIESARSLIAALRRYLPATATPVPLVWPSFTWAVWMSCLVLVYAAWEGELPVAAAARYTKSGLSILQHLALRDSAWPQTCIEALRDLESALSQPAPADPPLHEQQQYQQPPEQPDSALGTLPPEPVYNPSVIFGDSTLFTGFPTDTFFPGDGSDGDLWTVADGPWLLQENHALREADMLGPG